MSNSRKTSIFCIALQSGRCSGPLYLGVVY